MFLGPSLPFPCRWRDALWRSSYSTAPHPAVSLLNIDVACVFSGNARGSVFGLARLILGKYHGRREQFQAP